MEADFEMQKTKKSTRFVMLAEFIVTVPCEPVEPMPIRR
jgi:hypothetical protein